MPKTFFGLCTLCAASLRLVCLKTRFHLCSKFFACIAGKEGSLLLLRLLCVSYDALNVLISLEHHHHYHTTLFCYSIAKMASCLIEAIAMEVVGTTFVHPRQGVVSHRHHVWPKGCAECRGSGPRDAEGSNSTIAHLGRILW